MANSSPELQHLLHVLESRGLPFGEDDVAWAFESSKNKEQAKEWVQKYLQSPNLLTKDELAFFQKHGLPDSRQDAPSGRPLTDPEFESAIESLKSSTAAIEKQCLIMEQQKRALQKLQSQNSSDESALASKERRQTKFAREKATLDFDIDQLSQSTGTHLRSSIKQVDATSGSLPAGVDRMLEKDDRLLDGLQKLLPKISDASLDSNEALEVEQLCSTLTRMAVEEIRARLDRVYKESLLEYSRRAPPEKDLSEQQIKQRETQRIELDELGSEIDGLVNIVVDNQHRKPLTQGLLTNRAESQTQKARWAEYTVTALAYLTSRLDAISDHIQKLQAHGGALRTVNKVLEEAMAVEQNLPGAPLPSTPNPDRSAARGLKPLRLVQANISETQDPALAFLREHDVRIVDSDSLSKLNEILDTAVIDRDAKVYSLSKSTHETTTGAIVQSLARADADLHHLLGALHGQSTHGSASLVDRTLQHDLDKLERQTQQLGDAMRNLDLDAIARSVRAKQDEAVARLSR